MEQFMSETHRIRDNINVIEWMKEVLSTYPRVSFTYDEVDKVILATDKIYEEVGTWLPATGGLGYGTMLCPPHPSTWSAEYVRAVAKLDLSDNWSITECTYLGKDEKDCHQFLMTLWHHNGAHTHDQMKYTLKQISIDSLSDVHVSTLLVSVSSDTTNAFKQGVVLGRTLLTSTGEADEYTRI